MAGIGPVELGILALLATLAVVLPGLALLRTGRLVQVRREWRLVQLTRLAGIVVGLVLAAFAPDGSGLGPVVLGLTVLVTVVLGETVVRPRRPTGARTASLSRRRVRDYAPRHLSRFVLASTASTVVLAAASFALLGEDPRYGRVVLRGCLTDSSFPSETDSAAMTPALVPALAAVLVVAALAARQVVRRPRGMGATDVDDDALRRRSLEVVLAALGFASSMSGVVVVTRLLNAADQSTGGRGCLADASWSGSMQTAGYVLAVLYIGIALICIVEVLTGQAVGPRRVRSRESASR